MALPVAPFLFKFVVLKVLKGALIGVLRFSKRVIHKKHINEEGEPLSGTDRIQHIVTNEWRRKDNVLYLILMLSNAFYGAQELCLWLWYIYARRKRKEYCAFVPARLELPDKFVDRVHHLPWPTLYKETLFWIGMASLLYWPMPRQKLQLHYTDAPHWTEVRWRRMTYMIRNDISRKIKYRDMWIEVTAQLEVRVTTDTGETAYLNPVALMQKPE